jgi:succinate dehydrogenase / fumarate reductase cytochrome b subunit
MQLMQLFRSSVGRKLFMACSGLILAGFVVVHLLGNTTLFAGSAAINAYAEQLRKLGPVLWIFRFGLLGALLIHVTFGIWLTLQNRAAKPIGYARKIVQSTTMAAETMIYSGLALLAFVIYHLLHFTLHKVGLDPSLFSDAAGQVDVFRMMVLSFQQWRLVLLYVGGLTALFLHLSHGISSTFQTLGACNDQLLPLLRRAGLVAALVLLVGYLSIPLLTYFGLVTL